MPAYKICPLCNDIRIDKRSQSCQKCFVSSGRAARVQRNRPHLPNPGQFKKGQTAWNRGNGETHNSAGYILVAVGYEPKTRRLIQEYKHRLIMEQYLKCKLESHLIVHHRDGNPKNNELDNLEVMTQGEHMRRHREKKEN